MGKIEVYSFSAEDLTVFANQVKSLLLENMKTDGSLSKASLESWERRAVLVNEPSFFQKLFGELFTKSEPAKRLCLTVVVHTEASNDAKAKGFALPVKEL